MYTGRGRGTQPDIPLAGSLDWQTIDAGCCAAFSTKVHTTPLCQSGNAITKDWLPRSGEKLRDSAPMKRLMNDSRHTAPTDLLSKTWIQWSELFGPVAVKRLPPEVQEVNP